MRIDRDFNIIKIYLILLKEVKASMQSSYRLYCVSPLNQPRTPREKALRSLLLSHVPNGHCNQHICLVRES